MMSGLLCLHHFENYDYKMLKLMEQTKFHLQERKIEDTDDHHTNANNEAIVVETLNSD